MNTAKKIAIGALLLASTGIMSCSKKGIDLPKPSLAGAHTSEGLDSFDVWKPLGLPPQDTTAKPAMLVFTNPDGSNDTVNGTISFSTQRQVYNSTNSLSFTAIDFKQVIHHPDTVTTSTFNPKVTDSTLDTSPTPLASMGFQNNSSITKYDNPVTITNLDKTLKVIGEVTARPADYFVKIVERQNANSKLSSILIGS